MNHRDRGRLADLPPSAIGSKRLWASERINFFVVACAAEVWQQGDTGKQVFEWQAGSTTASAGA